MSKIYNNLSIETLIKTAWFNQFDKNQKYEIMKGIEADLDVSYYSYSKFDWREMKQVRLGL